MSETTMDSAIKLFGKKISLPANDEIPSFYSRPEDDPQIFSSPQEKKPKQDKEAQQKEEEAAQEEEDEEQGQKDTLSAKATEVEGKDQAAQNIEESPELAASSMIVDDPKSAPVDTENASADAQNTEEERSETSASKEKTVKKPDKILPCPRCNSLDTKFCYYNNYNVNQPRHFCKKCQRYWTAGGTMRNVPVGAGRRKNKNSSSHYRHITVSEALQTARTDMPEALHHNPLKPNGTVLSFGSDAPFCESMASVLSIAEKTVRNCHGNGFHHRTEEQAIPVSCGGCCDNGEEHSSGSSVTASNSAEEGNRANLQEQAPHSCQPLPPHIPCFIGSPWNYPWNAAQWGSPVAPPPAFCASSFPVSFYTAPAYWGCAVPGTWSIPWLSPPSSSPNNAGCSGSVPHSPTLGKHSREGNMLKQSDAEKEETLKQSNPERCLWIPKTLRIDDPGEAAKSSIWATLGIKNDGKADTVSSRGFFKDFHSKGDVRNQMAETSPVLHANPAALSRSLTFHESS
ncbi:hypothetical protein AAC387_Pa07g0027 [Persea americana]